MPPTRRTRNRTPGDKDEIPSLLIVTEDSVTEPNYFRDFCAPRNLGSVDVVSSPDPDPISLAEHALELYPGDNEYDRLYCVFDRDTHSGFEAAVDYLLNASTSKHPIECIYSVPCFEYWVLLHFELMGPLKYYTGSGSPCASVVDDIESNSHITDYSSVKPDIYNETKSNLEEALQNSKTRWGQHGNRDYDDRQPRTRIHELIEDLQWLR